MSNSLDISKLPEDIIKQLNLDEDKIAELRKMQKDVSDNEAKSDSKTGNSSKIVDRQPDLTIKEEMAKLEEMENAENEFTPIYEDEISDLADDDNEHDVEYDIEEEVVDETVEEEIEEEIKPEPVKTTKPVAKAPVKAKPVPTEMSIDDIPNEDDSNTDDIDPIDRLTSNMSSSASTVDVFSDSTAILFGDDETKPKEEVKEKKTNTVETDAYTNVTVSKTNNSLSFIDAITVDLNNIEISSKSPLRQVDDIDIIFNRKSSFGVVCCQSCYQASLSALSLADINVINNSTLDAFTHRQRLYKTVYNKIESMNIGKVSFDEWLKITAFGDWDTLLFGVYCQTYPDDNNFDITCGNCGRTTAVKVNNQTLIETRTNEITSKIDEIIASAKTPADIINDSLVNKSERVFLDNSKIIVEIKTPSLYDHLKLIKSVNRNLIDNYPETVSTMLFIKAIYIPDLAEIKRTGKPVYYPVTALDRTLDILLKLSTDDGERLEKALINRSEKYKISYSIQRAKCAHCNTVLPNIPVDMETILFRRINNKTSNQED